MSQISEFYRGKSVFLTGVTGFLGKAILEKLLRSCPGVHAIYCLVRPKKSKSAQERLRDTLNDPAFETVRSCRLAGCVQVIEGDITSVGLGLSSVDRTLLKENVNIVLHCAATVSFVEPLRFAAECNLRGVRELIQLCQGMQQLESFVHVSTAYANTEQNPIDENIYPCAVSPHELLDIIETLDDNSLQEMTTELLGEKPNTYVFTKHLAEVLLQTEASNLPVSIVRPPVVIGSWKEPVPGWMSGWNTFGLIFLGVLMGIIKAVPADENHKLDFMPVDLVVNWVLTASWHDKISKEGLGSKVYPTVYQLSSGDRCPNSWAAMRRYTKKHVEEFPFTKSVRPFSVVITSNRLRYNWIALIDHWLFACVFDGLLRCSGQKPRLIPVYKKLHTQEETSNFFLSRNYVWSTSNTDAMRSNMSSVDQKLFYFDPTEISWDSYWINYLEGARQYLFKEDSSDVQKTRARLRLVNSIQLTFKVFAICAACGLAERRFGLRQLFAKWFRTFVRFNRVRHR